MDYRISELEQRYVVLCYGMKLLAPTADNNNNPLRSRILNPLRSGTVTGDRDNNELIERKETERIGKKLDRGGQQEDKITHKNTFRRPATTTTTYP